LLETARDEDLVVSLSVQGSSKGDVVSDGEVSKEGLLVNVGDSFRSRETADRSGLEKGKGGRSGLERGKKFEKSAHVLLEMHLAEQTHEKRSLS